MKIRKLVGLTVIIFFVLTFAILSIAQKIESGLCKESKVKVVNNPGTPLYGKIKLEIEEDLSIGNEDDENYTFYKGISFDVDKNGNIFVLDYGNCRVQKYDKASQFLTSFGRKGEGPGEFNNPRDIFIDLNGNVIIRDYLKLHIFNGKGMLKDNINISFEKFVVTPEGHYLGKTSPRFPINKVDKIVLMSKEGKVIKTIAEKPDNSSFRTKIMKIIFFKTFHKRLHFSSLNNGFGVFFYSTEYELNIINPSGNINQIIKKEQQAAPFTRKEKIEIRNSRKKSLEFMKLSNNEFNMHLNFPKNKPAYSKVLTDDQDRLYASKWKFKKDEPKETIYHLFSKEGRFLYEITSPINFDIIKNGYIYKSTFDPDNENDQVKRYKIKNWDKIKSE